ncbi:unnamed protein product, partial [Allacma fusca]
PTGKVEEGKCNSPGAGGSQLTVIETKFRKSGAS